MAYGPASVHQETSDLRLHVMGHFAHDFETAAADDRLIHHDFKGVGRVAVLGGFINDGMGDMDRPETELPIATVFQHGEEPAYTVCIFDKPDEQGTRATHTSVLTRAVGQNVLSGHVWPIELHNYSSLSGLIAMTEYSKIETVSNLMAYGAGFGKLLQSAQEASAGFTVESVKRAARKEKWAQKLGTLGLISDNAQLLQPIGDAKRLYGTA